MGNVMMEGFSRDELSRLEKRFHKLDLDHSGTISIQEFLALPELKENPLVKRVAAVLDEDNSGEVDFKEFVLGLSQFAVRDDTDERDLRKSERMRFMFSIYDVDRDGFISNGELFQVLKMMTGNSLSDAQLQQIVDKTLIYLDKDGDGKLSFDEFCGMINERKGLKEIVEFMNVEV